MRTPIHDVGMRAAGTLAVATTALSGATACSGASAPATAAPASGGSDVAAVLRSTWHGYVHRFIQADGRVIDPKRGGASTSEGQSYALLRAVWMDDRQTFARVLSWTQDNLRTADGLFGYLWGRQTSGGWGLLSHDSATDADQDIALALLLAAGAWPAGGYRDAARAVVAAIWRNEVASVGGTFYATAGNWAVRTLPGPTLNPSYFAPYAYRLFAAVDQQHRWTQLVDSSYRALDEATAAPLSTRSSAGLPPNWCLVTDRGVQPDRDRSGADDYGYDAFRVMWRVALDLQWNGETRARDYLQQRDFLRREWHAHHRLAAIYAHDGSVVAGDQDIAVAGGDLGNLAATDRDAAVQLVHDVLLPSVTSHDGVEVFADPDNYYQQNWAWFGLALASGRIPPPSA